MRALVHDKGNLSTSLKGLEAKCLIFIARRRGRKAEAVDLISEERNLAATLTEVVNKEKMPR